MDARMYHLIGHLPSGYCTELAVQVVPLLNKLDNFIADFSSKPLSQSEYNHESADLFRLIKEFKTLVELKIQSELLKDIFDQACHTATALNFKGSLQVLTTKLQALQKQSQLSFIKKLEKAEIRVKRTYGDMYACNSGSKNLFAELKKRKMAEPVKNEVDVVKSPISKRPM